MNRELLDRPFNSTEIKQRINDRGERVDYLEGATVIQRLNDAFAADWSFEITEHVIRDNEMVVLGRLTAGGITKTQFGSKVREESAGDDLKAASTDAIKKCATLFGIGLQLYFEEKTVAVPAAAPEVRPASNGNGHGRASEVPESRTAPTPAPAHTGYTNDEPAGDPAGRLTNKQLSAIFGIARGRGWSSKEVRDFVKDKYGKVIDYLTKREASLLIDNLKAGTR